MSTPETRTNNRGAPLCHATNRAGEPCRAPAMRGQKVCHKHGGASPQAKRKAKIRLAALVDPAITVLAREMTSAEQSRDRQAAANSVLDRAGYARTSNVTTEDARELLLQRLLDAQEEGDLNDE